MAQLSLGQFKTEAKEGEVDSWASFRDSFDELSFESEEFKSLCLEEMIIFKTRASLKCERALNSKNKVEFIVLTINIINDYEPILDSQSFKTKELAVDFFEGQRELFKWNCELNNNNKVFDGQRYVWKLGSDGEINGERGWT